VLSQKPTSSRHLSETLTESSHINQFVAGGDVRTNVASSGRETRGMSFDVILVGGEEL